jgi:hypothetical protein
MSVRLPKSEELLSRSRPCLLCGRADKSGDLLVKSRVSSQMYPMTDQKIILPLRQSGPSSDGKITTRHWKLAELIVIDPKLHTLAQDIDSLENLSCDL